MTTGEDLRAARRAGGLSLARAAEQTHFAKSYLSMVETGARPVSVDVVAAYEHLLGAPLAAQHDPVRLAHEWLVADHPTMRHTAAGRRIGASLVEELEQRVVHLRHLDDVVSSTQLLPVVCREREKAMELSRTATYSESAGRRLHVVAGELSQLAGWVASDAGHYGQAERYYLTGVAAATDAGDRVLAAQLLSSLSYQMANVGSPHDAVLVARTAVAGAPEATPVVRTLFLERVAWAAARARDTDATRGALDAVDDAYEQRGGDEPEWVYWLDRSEIDVMAGRCHIELANPHAAEPLLAAAIETYPADHSREVALYLAWLAQAHAQIGNLDAAHVTLQQAQRYADAMPSVRTTARLHNVDQLLRAKKREG